MAEATAGDRMTVLRMLSEGRISSDDAVALLRALSEGGAGAAGDPGAEERAAVLRLLEEGRVEGDDCARLLKAMRDAGMGRFPVQGVEERATVLQMLVDGRIDVDDAEQLLRALRRSGGADAGGGAAGGQPSSDAGPGDPFDARFRPRFEFRRGFAPERAAQRAVERARRAADFWSQHAEDIAERAGKAAEQVGENMGRVLAGVPDLVERMAKAGWGNWGPGYRFEDVVEGDLPPGGQAVLDLEGWNGAVAVRPVDGDRVRLVLRKNVHAPSEEEARQVADAVEAFVDADGRRVRVGRRQGRASWPGSLAVEAYVPRGAEWTGDVRTGNGALDVDGLRVRGLRLETSNGAVHVESCGGEDLSATTSNGRVEVSGALAGRTELRTSNGSVVVAPSGEVGGEAWLRATTSNGAIEVRLPPTVAVEIDAATSNGKFDLSGLGPDAPDMQNQKGFGRNEVRWRSPSWDDAGAHLHLQLRTSNGGVRLV